MQAVHLVSKLKKKEKLEIKKSSHYKALNCHIEIIEIFGLFKVSHKKRYLTILLKYFDDLHLF